MADYYTRHDSMTQAVNVYIPLLTATDGTTLSSLKTNDGHSKISKIIATVSVDGAVTIDIASLFYLKLGGKALPQGDQEIVLGSISSVEVGTSVGASLDQVMAVELNVDIPIVGGNEITVSGAFTGTDLGTPFLSVTLEVR